MATKNRGMILDYKQVVFSTEQALRQRMKCSACGFNLVDPDYCDMCDQLLFPWPPPAPPPPTGERKF